ncbi:hypothetical protein [Streptomyces sp. NPDC048269]|uniref:hypothetical protein n=1 Tax=Streptomyces sp. NPDC048269 TaxID=3155753 RepID=UPI003434AC3E
MRIVLDFSLSVGQALLAEGEDPGTGGWRPPPNLVWAARHGILEMSALRAHLPAHFRWWPAPLKELLVDPVYMARFRGKFGLMTTVSALLFPHELDLQAFRVLLLLAMGDATSEKVHDLSLDDLEFSDEGVSGPRHRERPLGRAHGLRDHHYLREEPQPMSHTRRILPALAIAGLLATAGTAATAADDDPAPATKTTAPADDPDKATKTTSAVQGWEYRWAKANPKKPQVGELEKLGKEGWDAVGPIQEYNAGVWIFLLKRPI